MLATKHGKMISLPKKGPISYSLFKSYSTWSIKLLFPHNIDMSFFSSNNLANCVKVILHSLILGGDAGVKVRENLGESVLSFQHTGVGDQTQVLWPGGKVTPSNLTANLAIV